MRESLLAATLAVGPESVDIDASPNGENFGPFEIVTAAAEAPALPAVASPGKPKQSLRILCIDDDAHILELMSDCLTHFEHRVVVASSGKQGLQLFRAASLSDEPYDVVMTDLGMPEMDGHQVARTIRAESPKTPIIMMTGWGSMARDDENIAPAVDVVVSKPPRILELNELLLRLVPVARI